MKDELQIRYMFCTITKTNKCAAKEIQKINFLQKKQNMHMQNISVDRKPLYKIYTKK